MRFFILAIMAISFLFVGLDLSFAEESNLNQEKTSDIFKLKNAPMHPPYQEFEIPYNITNGVLGRVGVVYSYFIIEIYGSDDGLLEIEIPKNLHYVQRNQDIDFDQFILIDGSEVIGEQINNTCSITYVISFPKGSHDIEILGTVSGFYPQVPFKFDENCMDELENRNYKAPLRQIRDDGVSLGDVKCNKEKVLFFKISNKMPVCIFENSIDHFSNDWIGWFGVHNESFLTHYDLKYVNEKNSMLKRNSTVTYSVDQASNSIIYDIQEQISNLDSNSVMYDPFFENGLYEIVDKNGNNPVDWDDPRTSIGNINSGWDDVGRNHNLVCDWEIIESPRFLSGESSFKISKDTPTIFLNFEERILFGDYDQINENEFNHTFLSQGKTNFVFKDELEELDISDKACETNHLSKIYLYEIKFQIRNNE